MYEIDLMVCSAFFIYSNAFAATGKAIIPHYVSMSNGPTDQTTASLMLSNITNSTISVKIALYNQNGSVLVDGDNSLAAGPITGYNLLNFIDNAGSGYSVSFDLYNAYGFSDR